MLASLWSVTDRSTAELMKRFYGHLKAGMSKDEALRAAQIELIQGTFAAMEVDDQERGVRKLAKSDDGPAAARYASPYYWAAFELFGDWR